MKLSGRLPLLVVFVFLSTSIKAQEIFFTISGEYNDVKISLDSLLFDNLTNATSVSFKDLPFQEEYVINLTTQELEIPEGIGPMERYGQFEVGKCIPGELNINFYETSFTNASIEIYDLSGKRVFLRKIGNIIGEGSITIRIEEYGMYMIRLQSSERTELFKAIGTVGRGNIDVTFSNQGKNAGSRTKSAFISAADDFGVQLGDSLLVSAFKDTLTADPIGLIVEENNIIEFTFTEAQPVDTTKVTDIDGNIYNILKIGDQYWMAEDLRTTHYANGDAIPDGTGIGDYWEENEPSYWFTYNDSLEYVPTYGRLYTWYAASDARNVCPAGWYLPGNAEWDTLESYLGGWEVAGGKMKEAGMDHWMDPNEGATNESGFNALPGGARQYYGGFNFLGTDGHWWSSTHSDEDQAWYRNMSNFTSSLMKADPDKRYGFSVRCIKDTGPPGTLASVLTLDATDVTDTSAVVRWNITNDGGSEVTETGIYCGPEPNPQLTGNKVPTGSGTGEFSFSLINLPHSSVFHVAAYAINSEGESIGNEKVFLTTVHYETGSVTDIEGNSYRTVKLWDQWWMAENLRVTHYSDGTPIPVETDNTAWGSLSEPGYCWYNNDSATHFETYGAIYNWYTVNTANLCPSGWRVPTDDEWTGLTDHLGGIGEAGGRLKETGTEHWKSPNTGATDEVEFTALPGGFRRSSGEFSGTGGYGSWWSSTEFLYDLTLARNLTLYSSGSNAGFRSDSKNQGSSVRCVQDTTEAGTKSFLKINESEFDLTDGILVNYGDFEGAGIYNHSVYLLSSGHDMNWETLGSTGSGAVVNFEIFNTQSKIESGEYPFSLPEIMNTILVMDTVICDSTDVNNDGIINEDDCMHIIVYTMPEGGKYISSRISVYDSNTNVNELVGLEFESGNVFITVEGDNYTLEFNCIGKNGDVISGYYKGKLHYYDLSEEDPIVTFQYDEALNDGYAKMSDLLEQSWLIDGIFCGEYSSPSSSWDNIANRTITSTDTQVSQLWNKAYNLIFNANNIIDSISYIDLIAEEKNRVKAEARAMRAYGYYILVSKFGDVPIYQGTAYEQIPRSAVSEVTDLIVADLMFASSYLPFRNYAENDKTRFDRGSAMALWTKVNLYMKNWTSAYDKSLEIMNSGNYILDGTNKYTSLASPENIQAYTADGTGSFYVTYDKGTVVTISHYTEQLLIAMECEIRMGNLNLAGALYYQLTGNTNNSPNLDDVFNLWTELMNKEGITLSTIKRYDKVGEMLMIMDFQAILPIPQTVLDTNPYMLQNPGY